VLKKDKDYERVYGKGMSLVYIVECIGAIAITYIYNWNAYAAYWISFGAVVLAEILMLFLKEPSKYQDRNVEIASTAQDATQKPHKSKKPDSYFKIAFSGFFIVLLIYMFFIRGALSIASSNYKIYLQQMTDLGVLPVWIFGYLYALSRISIAISSKYQFKFNLKFGVRSLLIINSLILITFLICGITYIVNPTAIWSIVIIVILSCVQGSLRIPIQIFVNNYMQVCMPHRNLERAYAIRTTVEYMGYALFSGLYALLLGVLHDSYGVTNLVYISILAIPIIVMSVIFIRALVKKHAQKFTIIKEEYTED